MTQIIFQVIGKQPEGDVWVFNDSVQINAQGQKVQKEEQQYIVLDDSRLPFLRGLKGKIAGHMYIRFLNDKTSNVFFFSACLKSIGQNNPSYSNQV